MLPRLIGQGSHVLVFNFYSELNNRMCKIREIRIQWNKTRISWGVFRSKLNPFTFIRNIIYPSNLCWTILQTKNFYLFRIYERRIDYNSVMKHPLEMLWEKSIKVCSVCATCMLIRWVFCVNYSAAQTTTDWHSATFHRSNGIPFGSVCVLRSTY